MRWRVFPVLCRLPLYVAQQQGISPEVPGRQAEGRRREGVARKRPGANRYVEAVLLAGLRSCCCLREWLYLLGAKSRVTLCICILCRAVIKLYSYFIVNLLLLLLLLLLPVSHRRLVCVRMTQFDFKYTASTTLGLTVHLISIVPSFDCPIGLQIHAFHSEIQSA